MRIDKFLKTSRLIKRRTVAKEITENNRIYINDKLVKPSYQVKIQDILKIYFGKKEIVVKIISLDEKKQTNMFELISEKMINIEDIKA